MRHRPYECGGHPTLRLDGVWPQGAPAPLFFFFFFWPLKIVFFYIFVLFHYYLNYTYMDS